MILITLYFINLLFLLLYGFYKSKNAFLAYQQSMYNNTRYLRYIRENYKYTLGVNELLMLFVFFIPNYHIRFLILCIIGYYNLKFFQISKKRYTEKLKLNKTSRVKRQFATFGIIILILLFVFPFKFLIDLILIIYLINFIIMFVGLINRPYDVYVNYKFKKKAIKKLSTRDDLCVIGVTGSYGKTSIKNIICDVLEDYEPTLKTPSSYNTPTGISITVNEQLTKLHKNFIAEMGAYKIGEIKELTDMVKPDIAIVSSIGPQHLETFKNIQNVQRTKMELVENLESGKVAILNYDNKYIRDYKIKNKKIIIKTYAIEDKNVDLCAYDIKYMENGISFKIKFLEKEYVVRTKLLGKHSIYNILAAIMVGALKKIDINVIIDSVYKIESIKNRLELKYIDSTLTIIDDSFNGNIEGMKEGINILQKMQGEKILITPGIIDGGSSNDDLNQEYGKYINEIDKVLIVGKYNREVLKKNISVETIEFDNFLDAYNYATQNKNKKTVLIANDLPDKYN